MPSIDDILNKALLSASKPKAAAVPGLSGSVAGSVDVDDILDSALESVSNKQKPLSILEQLKEGPLPSLKKSISRVLPLQGELFAEAKERFTKPESNIIDKIIGTLVGVSAPLGAITGAILGEPTSSGLQTVGVPEKAADISGIISELLVPAGSLRAASKSKKVNDALREAYGLNIVDPLKVADSPLKMKNQNQQMQSRWEKFIGPKFDSLSDSVGGFLKRLQIAENLTQQQQQLKQLRIKRRQLKGEITDKFKPLADRADSLSLEDRDLFAQNFSTPQALSGNATVDNLITDIHNSIKEVTEGVPIRKEVPGEEPLGAIDEIFERSPVKKPKPKNVLTNLIDETPGLLGARGITQIIERDSLDAYKEYGFRLAPGNKPGSAQVKVNRKFTKEEFAQLKELDFSANYIANIGKSLANDVSAFQFYDDINKNFSSLVGNVTKKTPGYKKISERKIRGTNLFQKGALAGKFVPEDLANDIATLDQWRPGYENIPGIKQYLKWNRAWKIVRTAYSPRVQFGNFLSAGVLFDVAANARKGTVITAAKELKNKGKLYDLAKKQGVFRSGFVREEKSGFSKDAIDIYFNAIRKEDDLSHNKIIETGGKIANESGKLGIKTHEGILGLYNLGDDLWRFATFIDRIEKGMNPVDAAVDARKILLDYDINAPVISVLRDFTHPFVGFTYRVIPTLAEASVKHPVKFALWATLGYGLQQALTDDEKKSIELLPERQRRTVGGIPGAPSTLVKVGENKVVNINRIIPGGNIFEDAGFGIPFVPEPFQPSGGLAGSIGRSFVLGQNQFGEPLPESPTSNLDKLKVRAESFAEANVPNIPGVPYAPSTKQLRQAISGEYSPFQDPKTLVDAALGTIGIDIINLDKSRSIQTSRKQLQNDLSALGKMKNKLKSDLQKGLISQQGFDIELKKIQNEEILLKAKFREKIR